jgi:adenylylsulfate kinase
LQTAAAKEGFSLVSKGSKGKTAADKHRQVLICARGRVVPASRRDRADSSNNTRPLVSAEICRFRLTIHQDHNVDRYLIKGGQGNSFHRCHDKLEGHVPKKIHRSAIVKAAISTNVVWHTTSLSRTDRWKDHKGAVLWFTGLSGSGKSTIANEVECLLHRRSVRTYLLDGDNLRHGLCQDLGFSQDERWENLRRAAEVARLMADAGLVVLCAFVSPYQAHREQVKNIIANDGSIPFCEIYVKAHVAICEKRDPKGLYLKARAGILKNFTGITDPYEEPTHPDVLLDSTVNSVQILADQVVDYLDLSGKIVLSSGT